MLLSFESFATAYGTLLAGAADSSATKKPEASSVGSLSLLDARGTLGRRTPKGEGIGGRR
jgi:hypothetical protein